MSTLLDIIQAQSSVEACEPMGTKVSEYIESKVPRKCGACSYFSKGHCNQEDVMKDPEVKTDKKTQTKVVDAELGCCRYWKPAQKK